RRERAATFASGRAMSPRFRAGAAYARWMSSERAPADGEGAVDPGRAGPAADVGRWFSTATAAPLDGPGPTRGGPRMTAWGPMVGAEYGRRSPRSEVSEALGLLRGRPVAVLTGAGTSTGSGLPAYR